MTVTLTLHILGSRHRIGAGGGGGGGAVAAAGGLRRVFDPSLGLQEWKIKQKLQHYIGAILGFIFGNTWKLLHFIGDISGFDRALLGY